MAHPEFFVDVFRDEDRWFHMQEITVSLCGFLGEPSYFVHDWGYYVLYTDEKLSKGLR